MSVNVPARSSRLLCRSQISIAPPTAPVATPPPGSATTTRNGPWFVQPHQVPAYAVAVDQCLRQAGAQPFEQLRGEPIVVEHQPVIATIGRRISVLGAIHGSFLLAASAPGTVPRGSSATQVKAMVRGLLE